MTWTFLSNHGHVVIQINRNPDIRLSDLALVVGVSERRIRTIVRELNEAGYISIVKQGRRNTYRVETAKSLRHSAESQKSLGDLLAVFDVKS